MQCEPFRWQLPHLRLQIRQDRFSALDEGALSPIAYNPFPDKSPGFIKIDFCEYTFEKPFSGLTWHRTCLEPWLHALGADNRALMEFIDGNGSQS